MALALANEMKVNLLSPPWSKAIAEIETKSFPTPWSEELIRAEFQKAFSLILGVTYGEFLLGYSLNHLIADELHLLTFAVHPDYRNRGIGAVLLRELGDEALRRGGKSIYLEVRRGNFVAQRLYNSFGFSVIGHRARYYSDNGEDALVLRKTLAD